ncbi:hypothetical protein ABTE37_19970, partial [Acinetobacter baumannii]
KKGAPDAAKDSLNFCRKEGEEANSLRSNSLLSFSSLQQKFKAPHRAGKVKRKKTNHLGTKQNDKANLTMGWPLSFDVRPLMAPW